MKSGIFIYFAVGICMLTYLSPLYYPSSTNIVREGTGDSWYECTARRTVMENILNVCVVIAGCHNHIIKGWWKLKKHVGWELIAKAPMDAV